MKTISAADANRHFSSLLRDVATGEVVTVVSRGKPVAVISAANHEDAFKLQAHKSLVARLISKSMWVALDSVGDYSSANHYLN
jgi:prevent-host-death family protein